MGKLYTTLTQGSADAFVQATVQTALEGLTTTAYKINRVTLEFAQAFVGASAANYEVALTRRSKAAMPNITDQDVMMKKALRESFTTSGMIILDGVIEYTPAIELLVVEDYLYFQLDSNGTSVANTVYALIEYEIQRISEIDRLTLLTQSLT